jgi:hypothetical protein
LLTSQLSGEVASGVPSNAMIARQVDSNVQLKHDEKDEHRNRDGERRGERKRQERDDREKDRE